MMSSIWDIDERIVEQQAISFKVFENEAGPKIKTFK